MDVSEFFNDEKFVYSETPTGDNHAVAKSQLYIINKILEFVGVFDKLLTR